MRTVKHVRRGALGGRGYNALAVFVVTLLGCSSGTTAPQSRSATGSSATTAAASTPATTNSGASGAAASGKSVSTTTATTISAAGAGAGATPAGTANGAAATGGNKPPAPAGCEPNALDQKGCPCSKAGATRACYSADPATRNIGACKDGIQTCVGGTTAADAEFGMQYWGPCMEQVIPTECKAQLDARCVGKVGCADEQCADKLGCPRDAGMPDAGNKHCRQVMGFGFGTGIFADGGMWCER